MNCSLHRRHIVQRPRGSSSAAHALGAPTSKSGGSSRQCPEDGARMLVRPHPGPTAIEVSDAARLNLLPLPARNERGEGWGEGKPDRKCPSSPRPSPPDAGGEGEPSALSAVLSLNSMAVHPAPLSKGRGNAPPKCGVSCGLVSRPPGLSAFSALMICVRENGRAPGGPPRLAFRWRRTAA